MFRTTFEGRFRFRVRRAALDARGCTPRSIRKPDATLRSDGGVPERVMKAGLGHVRTDITGRVYRHLDPSAAERTRGLRARLGHRARRKRRGSPGIGPLGESLPSLSPAELAPHG